MLKQGTRARRGTEAVVFLQWLLNVLTVVLSYALSSPLHATFGRPYVTENAHAVLMVLPWILVVYSVFYAVYGIGSPGTDDTYELILSQIIVCVLTAVMAFAVSFFVRAFAFPRSLVSLGCGIQILLLSWINYGFLRIYRGWRLRRLYLCVSGGGAEDLGLSRLLAGRGLCTKVVSAQEAEEGICRHNGTIGDNCTLVLPNSVDSEIRSRIVRLASLENIPVYLEPTVYSLLLQSADVRLLGDQVLLQAAPVSPSGSAWIAKRLVDIVVAVAALVIFSPFLLVASLAILLESGRPVLYAQERVGLDGCSFRVYKLRTMVQGAEDRTGAVLASDHDARITRVGRILRKTGLDEVPQFLNVLSGTMSVVGPRPERRELIETIKTTSPDYDLRLTVKPGITGLAQIRGTYDTTPERKLALDLTYIGHRRSVVLMDIGIMLNTLKMFFMPRRRR